MSGATETREIARKALVSCAECGKATPGAGNSDLCDVCYGEANSPLACPSCGTVTGDGERCGECEAVRAEDMREAMQSERYFERKHGVAR